MSSLVTQTYNLDIIPFSSMLTVPVSQYDVGRKIVFNIVNSSDPYFTIPEDATAVIDGMKPDDKAFEYSAEVKGNTVSVDLTEQMTAVSGYVECEIVISQSGNRIATGNFQLHVENAAMDESKISESDLSVINEATKAASASAAQAKDSADKAASSASAAADSAASAKTTQTDTEDLKNQAANSASQAGNSAKAAATSASNAKTSETNAKTSETNAGNSTTAAKASETNASDSATRSANSATAAAGFATEAKNSADAAANSAESASGSAKTASDAAADINAKSSQIQADLNHIGTPTDGSYTSKNNSNAANVAALDKQVKTNADNSKIHFFTDSDGIGVDYGD